MEHIFRIVDFNVYNGKDTLFESSDDETNVYKDSNNFVHASFRKMSHNMWLVPSNALNRLYVEPTALFPRD